MQKFKQILKNKKFKWILLCSVIFISISTFFFAQYIAETVRKNSYKDLTVIFYSGNGGLSPISKDYLFQNGKISCTAESMSTIEDLNIKPSDEEIKKIYDLVEQQKVFEIEKKETPRRDYSDCVDCNVGLGNLVIKNGSKEVHVNDHFADKTSTFSGFEDFARGFEEIASGICERNYHTTYYLVPNGLFSLTNFKDSDVKVLVTWTDYNNITEGTKYFTDTGWQNDTVGLETFELSTDKYAIKFSGKKIGSDILTNRIMNVENGEWKVQ